MLSWGLAGINQSESVSSLGMFNGGQGTRVMQAMFGLPAGTTVFSPPCPLLWLMNTGRFPWSLCQARGLKYPYRQSLLMAASDPANQILPHVGELQTTLDWTTPLLTTPQGSFFLSAQQSEVSRTFTSSKTYFPFSSNKLVHFWFAFPNFGVNTLTHITGHSKWGNNTFFLFDYILKKRSKLFLAFIKNKHWK